MSLCWPTLFPYFILSCRSVTSTVCRLGTSTAQLPHLTLCQNACQSEPRPRSTACDPKRRSTRQLPTLLPTLAHPGPLNSAATECTRPRHTSGTAHNQSASKHSDSQARSSDTTPVSAPKETRISVASGYGIQAHEVNFEMPNAGNLRRLNGRTVISRTAVCNSLHLQICFYQFRNPLPKFFSAWSQ